MARESINNEENNGERFFILKFLIHQLVVIIGLASIMWLLKDGDFKMCCYKSAFLMSIAALVNLLIEVLWALDNNHWRIKLANEEYQVYKGFILIILNSLVILLTGPKGCYWVFLIIIVPLGMLIMIRRIRRWLGF